VCVCVIDCIPLALFLCLSWREMPGADICVRERVRPKKVCVCACEAL
jgi:hypothetical protein